MVEARARFFSQLEGRWRWVVEVRVGLGPTGSMERAVFETFEVPVFLRHQHQGPEAAIDAAAPLIGPKVARLLRQGHRERAAERSWKERWPVLLREGQSPKRRQGRKLPSLREAGPLEE